MLIKCEHILLNLPWCDATFMFVFTVEFDSTIKETSVNDESCLENTLSEFDKSSEGIRKIFILQSLWLITNEALHHSACSTGCFTSFEKWHNKPENLI